MKNIEKIHEAAFTYLNRWSEENRSNNSINPYFYMRSVRDERFKKGYWFPGNESYLCVSFWAGGDSQNKTPNVYFEISEQAGCRIIVVAKDSELKYEYFNRLFLQKKNIHFSDFVENKKTKTWIKVLSKYYSDWEHCLRGFIYEEKKIIDSYVSENQFSEYEEFVSKFGFISAPDFDTMYSRVLKERDLIKEAEYNKQREFYNKPKLPFALLGISIENFQGIKNTSLNDLPPDARWIFITGENGYGKTTLLQAIALGLSGDPDLEKYLDDKTRISIELTSRNEKAFPVRTKGNISNLERFDYGQYVLGYGPARLNVQSKASENKENKSGNNVISLFDNETLLKNINYELFASNYADTRTFEELGSLIKTVTKGRISEIEIFVREALFVETLSNGDKLDPIPLSKLAAGFRSIINIAIDIYLRFRNIHSNLFYRDFFGIVLIDEIENHLHPILQRELPKALSEVFPKIQFIISTHSPIPLLAAEKNAVILKVNREKNEGVRIVRLDEEIDFPNLLPNTILTSPIFGFQDIFSESKSEDSFVRVENTYSQVLENNQQNERIDNYLNDETTSELMKLLKK